MTRAPVILGLVIAILPGWARGEEVSVDFATGVFDRLIFRPDYGFGYGRWESRGQGLRATIPPGVTGRNAMHFDCLMHSETVKSGCGCGNREKRGRGACDRTQSGWD